jgi:hypothetical protein
MILLDRTRALIRLLLFNSDAKTVSHDAAAVVADARRERDRASAAMDELLRNLVRARADRGQAEYKSDGYNR